MESLDTAVATFLEEHELETTPEYRLLDVQSELGEVAKEAATSTAYGSDPDELAVPADELGDLLFSTLALCLELDVDPQLALAEAIEKYRTRVDHSGDPGSGG